MVVVEAVKFSLTCPFLGTIIRRKGHDFMTITGRLRQQFMNNGFRCAASNRSEFSMFYQSEGVSVHIIHLIEVNQYFNYDSGRLQTMIQNTEQLFRDKGYQNIASFALVATDALQNARALCSSIEGYWIIQEPENRLLIYEDQPGEFYGIKAIVNQALNERSQTHVSGRYPGAEILERARDIYRFIGPVTIGLVLVNVIVHIVLSILGATEGATFSFFAMYPEALYNGDFYRLFTSTFMHFGIRHLAGNMLVLCLMGSMLERNLGRLPFLLVYLVSGVGGNVLSALCHLQKGQQVISAGASGSVFGVMGALACLVIMNKGSLLRENLTTQKILVFVGLSLYQGFSSSGVDNFAHVGGVITGALTAMICILIKREFEKSRMRG